MKVCKFEKMKEEDEIRQVINYNYATKIANLTSYPNVVRYWQIIYSKEIL